MDSLFHKLKMYPVILVVFLCLPVMQAQSQEEQFVPSRSVAMEKFSGDDFETALVHFRGLIRQFPADPLYKYYAGVSLVELKSGPAEAVDLLESAMRTSSSLRPVPDVGWYWLGRANQAAGNFDDAIDAFDRYRDEAKKKEAKELGVERLIDQCEAGIGAVSNAGNQEVVEEVVVDGPVLEIPAEEATEEIVTIDTVVIPQHEQENSRQVEIDQQYNKVARDALNYQFMADSVARLADRYRSTLGSLTGSDRESVTQKILALEELNFFFQANATELFAEASRLAGILFEGEGEIAHLEVSPEISEDALIADEDEFVDINLAEKTASIVQPDIDSTIIVSDSVVAILPMPKVLSVFFDDIDQPDNIAVNEELPEGLFYRIQTAAFRNPIAPSYFKKLGPVYGSKAPDSDITFYFIGLFRRVKDASAALVKVRSNGFRDAFVVALFEGKKVSLERAEILEKEWGDISLTGDSFVVNPQTKPKEPEEPPTLVYRVEVIKADKKLKEEEVEGIKILAGTRKFDIYETVDKQYVYLIGNFLTFESAESYSGLLFRNGMKDSHVVAYLGKREIPLETAKQLFETYFNKQD